jgi:transcriptional regulator with XRE-family HTH domain
MTETFSPPVWRRRIATEMKRLRRTAGLSQAEVAVHLGCRVPKISLIESSQRAVQDDDLQKLFELYDVADVDRDYYLTANKLGRQKAWWERYDEHILPASSKTYIGLEQGGHSLRGYSMPFHGLLQTPAYASAVLANTPVAVMGDELIRRKVAVRRRRKEAITREVDPLRLSLLVDESALHRVVGGPDVMREQLEHVLRLIRDHPHISVRIVPYESGAAFHDFSIISFSWPDDPGVIYMEHSTGVFLESLADIDAYVRVFKRFSEVALSPEVSVEVIEQAAAMFATSEDTAISW